MKIKYWTSFSKRKNSTLTPTGGTEVNAVLKGPTSELNPVFELQGVTSAKYVYCATFGRYYYVTDVVHLTDDIIQISCAVDVMSSFKGSIGGTYAYVEFAASGTDNYITDPRQVGECVVMSSMHDIVKPSAFDGDPTHWQYVISLVTDQGANFYRIGATNLDSLLTNIYTPNLWDQFKNQLIGASNIITSLKVLPITTYGESGDTFFTLGGENLHAAGTKLVGDERYIKMNGNYYTLAWPYTHGTDVTNYIDYSPFTSGVLYLPFVGCVPLDVEAYAQDRQIYIESWIDVATGDVVYKVGRHADYISSTYSGNCASDIPTGGALVDAMGVVSGGLSVIGGAAGAIFGAATENPVAFAGGIGGIGAGIMQTTKSLQHHTQQNGNISTAVGAMLGLTITYNISTRVPVGMNSRTPAIGKPFYDACTLSTLSGYVKCSGASVSISGYDSEREEINSYLNSGFFYE